MLLDRDLHRRTLLTALAHRRRAGAPGSARATRTVVAPGLRAADIVCTSGPSDLPFEERHPGMAICTVLAGTFSYRGEHGRTLFTPGSVLLGNADATFECSHEHGEGDRCLALHFDRAVFEWVAAALNVRRVRFPWHRLPASREMARALAAVETAFEEGDRLEEAALAVAAAALRASGEARAVQVSARDERRACEIARLIESDVQARYGLTDLAARAGMSRFHFLRVFARAVGATPHRFQLRLRLRAAARLLRATRQPVTAIAYDAGFEDLSQFIRSFKREFGQSPSRYRGVRPGSDRGQTPPSQ